MTNLNASDITLERVLDGDANLDGIDFPTIQKVHAVRAGLADRTRGHKHAAQLRDLLNIGDREYLGRTLVLSTRDEDGRHHEDDSAAIVVNALAETTSTFAGEKRTYWKVVCDGRRLAEVASTRDHAMLLWLEAKWNNGRAREAAFYAGRVLGLPAES